jgi:hypothetical protein
MNLRVASLFKFEQTTASNTWTIVHNMGAYPCVDAYVTYEGDLVKIIPNEVTYVDAMTCVLTFSEPLSGFATVS